ncbi:putative quinone oxidoreductase, YhdH/YhfP family [Pasteurella testudinis DSM 23072]|uniref:Putative quinone oxidoreductase, YhdH/YhfP family n=1 Tax=Pasteurella testudinis DSM 23072 TaxID=1122938 RepID=A0A1W1V2N5_9PAST|nr:MDR family oxidoreductase [Pasteurella testudinis]SMB87595.1 putative quinone oxidoreductase, YhdH/YhfP family [Pasteurella testudinis DSM 23072]SUB50500.1 Putative quinone oxidoreductase YhdH [Pasteurella testudinis]
MRALLLTQTDGKVAAAIQEIDLPDSPELVKVKVHYSGLNYKDGLALHGKLIRRFPLVVGIDFCGEVVSSPSADFSVGQKVLLTGFGYGESRDGGLAEYALVEPQHLLPLPSGLSARQAMIIGTAGFTAMLCVNALSEAGVQPQHGEVVVTGASGGVGSTALYLLKKLGYQTVAVSSKHTEHDQLRALGADRLCSRQQFDQAAKPLEKQQFAGLIDTVGGTILANLLSRLQYGATAAICGLAQSPQLNTTVMPFILRHIRLQGIDSVFYPIEKRAQVWQQLSQLLDDEFYRLVAQEIRLSDVVDYSRGFLQGQICGRTVVKIAD